MGTTFYEDPRATLYLGDARAVLVAMSDESAQCCVTSPPYWGLRDYGADGQLGMEPTPEEYVANLVEVFREVRRVLRDDGVLWLNLGDTYNSSPSNQQGGVGSTLDSRAAAAATVASLGRQKRAVPGLKPKDLIGIPWRVALALQADGWWLRSDIIWHKPNAMPNSQKDRPTTAHEYVFLLAKSEGYFYDFEASKEPAAQPNRKRADRFGGNKYVEGVKHSDGSIFVGSATRTPRTVWSINTQPSGIEHFAVMAPELARRCIVSGSRPGDVVLDPFNGAGTTGMVAMQRGRRYVGVELNPDYAQLAVERWQSEASQHLLFAEGL
jgi:DNA modification methylase